MRIAIVNKDRCQFKKCGHECINFCPRVRTGDETVVIGEDGKAVISEELCVGCGICIKKCPFDAIMIIGLPEELDNPVHRYGANGFALYGLPTPVQGKVTGILGPNGVGKSTTVNILSGIMMPNLGKDDTNWDEVLEIYSGSGMYEYMKTLSEGNIKASHKPQYVDNIPKAVKGKVSKLLNKADERGIMDEMARKLEIEHVLNRDIKDLSGGELQRVAMAACVGREADFYFIDEISPYLDIYQRINSARIIQELAETSAVMVIEHDLALLDQLADTVHVAYGIPAGYGVITQPKGVRVAINQYLHGFLAEENVRLRTEAIGFEEHPPREQKDIPTLLEFSRFTKKYGDDGFELVVGSDTLGNEIKQGEVIGIVGPNGIGKSTFVNILAGEETPTTGSLETDLNIAYKPQYLKGDYPVKVRDFLRGINTKFDTSYYQTEIIKPLQLDGLMDRILTELSGGELQRAAIAACLGKNAELYIFDEPSAHLDVEQRALATRVIRRFAENNNVTAMVVDHDIYMIDMLSERLVVFEGQPGVIGEVHGPFGMREGMNLFLKNLNITFRRDDETRRPRVNKPDSKLDRQQKSVGEYYYALE
ncbi:MAG: ribosome biogenesis/translation initiation ATPase RLI [Methanosarcinales archaeon]|nr:ribosome biogenesis/translation initiation ATPase RLI [Methanosarcinales archaeon]